MRAVFGVSVGICMHVRALLTDHMIQAKAMGFRARSAFKVRQQASTGKQVKRLSVSMCPIIAW